MLQNAPSSGSSGGGSLWSVVSVLCILLTGVLVLSDLACLVSVVSGLQTDRDRRSEGVSVVNFCLLQSDIRRHDRGPWTQVACSRYGYRLCVSGIHRLIEAEKVEVCRLLLLFHSDACTFPTFYKHRDKIHRDVSNPRLKNIFTGAVISRK